MEKYEVQKLRDLPIEEVAERLGMQVSRHKCLCPFHDDHHASFSFSTRKNYCRCYVCMEHPIGTIDLVMKYTKKDFLSACRWLADAHNVYIEERKREPTPPPPPSFDASKYWRFFEHPWLNEAARRFLFAERKLDERVVSWCRITSWTDKEGTNWLQIPYYDMDGKLIGIQNRNLDWSKGKQGMKPNCTVEKQAADANCSSRRSPSVGIIRNNDCKLVDKKVNSLTDVKDKPRFRFPYGSQCGIYNQPIVRLLKKGEPLYITEGCSDCWAMLSSGKKAIAIPSATLLKPADKQWLIDLSERMQTQWHMYPDKDAPGEQLFLQLKEILPQLEHHQLPPGCKDFSDYFVREIAHHN